MGHDAFFSEDMAIPGVPANVVEQAQQKLVHLVINIAASPGSMAEFENYGIRLGRRHLVFLNAAARGGFTDQGTLQLFRANGGFDEFFKDDDLNSCAVKLAAVDWVVEKSYLQAWVAQLEETAKEVSLV